MSFNDESYVDVFKYSEMLMRSLLRVDILHLGVLINISDNLQFWTFYF